MTMQRLGGSHLAPREVLPVADGEQEVRAGRLAELLADALCWEDSEKMREWVLDILDELGFKLEPR